MKDVISPGVGAEALEQARAEALAVLQLHPDWAALSRLPSDGGTADEMSFRARLLEGLAAVPAYRQLMELAHMVPEEAPAVLEAEPAAVPAAATIVDSAPPDDLTRIRGIDAAIAEQLAGLGVTRFTHIAHWWPQDIARISGELGLGRQIVRQCWVAQAALLTGPPSPRSTAPARPALQTEPQPEIAAAAPSSNSPADVAHVREHAVSSVEAPEPVAVLVEDSLALARVSQHR